MSDNETKEYKVNANWEEVFAKFKYKPKFDGLTVEENNRRCNVIYLFIAATTQNGGRVAIRDDKGNFGDIVLKDHEGILVKPNGEMSLQMIRTLEGEDKWSLCSVPLSEVFVGNCSLGYEDKEKKNED